MSLKQVKTRNFKSQLDRNSHKLLLQGGNIHNVDAYRKTKRCYDFLQNHEQKEANSMERLNKYCLKFDNYCSRDNAKSIYNSDKDITYLYSFDPVKIMIGKKKTTKNTGKGSMIQF